MAIHNRHADPVLLGLAVNAELESERLYDNPAFQPIDVTTAGRSGKLVLENKKNYQGRTDVDVNRARGDGRSVGEWKANTTVDYEVGAKGHELHIDELDEIDDDLDALEERMAEGGGQVVHTKLEREFMTLHTNTSVFPNASLSALSGISPKVNWLTNKNADPAADLAAMIWQRYKATGYYSDTVMLSQEAIEVLRSNANVRGYYNDGAGAVRGQGSELVTADQVIDYLLRTNKRLKQVFGSDDLEDTAGWNGATSLATIWPTSTLFLGRMLQRKAPTVSTKGARVTIEPVCSVPLVYNGKGYSNGWRASVEEKSNIKKVVAVDALSAWQQADTDMGFVVDLSS